MNLLQSIFSVGFASSVIRITVPILLAALAATMTSRAGVSNIGIEGTMSMTALFAIIFSSLSGSLFVGVLGAVLIGILLSLFIGVFAYQLKTNIILCGIAVNMLGQGGAVMFLYMFTGAKSDTASLGAFSLPTLFNNIPIIGGHSVLTYIAFLLVIVVYILLYKTPLGVRIRAVGENPNAADSVGVSVNKIRYLSLALCGAIAGLSGAYMSMSYMSMFSKGMIAGRGFIALAAEAMG
ncbi:MAG: ABC transporter permease, partial [Oscillospiraceae bacterium]|nr:ABC transporter permease [Oscillospiraceae bacterium]